LAAISKKGMQSDIARKFYKQLLCFYVLLLLLLSSLVHFSGTEISKGNDIKEL
jgi:hypothetical protein